MSIPNGQQRHNWRPVTADSPCLVCGHTGWCSVSADGTVAKCMRNPDGAYRTKKDKNGQEYHLHRLGGTAATRPAPPAPSAGPAVEPADADTRHRVYSDLLACLQLTEGHRDALHRRGLTDAEIDRRGYRTLSVSDCAARARALHMRYGDAVLSVPGFIVKPGERGPYVTLAGTAGMLVPVRDAAGRIVALLTRRDDASDGRRKYLYLSSAPKGGPGSGAPAHVPLGVTAGCDICRLTEGALKADVAFVLSGLPTVGAAGLAWRTALDAVLELGASVVRLSLDADALDNPHVARALADCYVAALAAGLTVEVERWDKADGKGIDDLLAAGKTPDVLTGEDARRAVAEIRATATAGQESAPADELARLPDVLNNGGAAALFGDQPLLDALARLADTEPAAYAARRATLKGQVSLRDLDASLRPLRRERARELPPVLLADAGYCIEGRLLCRTRGTPDGGTVLVPLCNFTARITATVVRDDGAEQTSLFTLAGALADGRALPPVSVPAADFAGMAWVTGAWHGEAVVYAGQGTRDHLRAAVELLSPDRARRTVYTHTGWRKIGADWHYLHGDGAIGPQGHALGVEVSLDALTGFALPIPPEREERTRAVRASLALLDGLASDRIAFPLLGAVYRAALGDAPGAIDLSVAVVGPHGAGKSELAALAQQHFGPALDARHLPGSWSSTANALEGLAFTAKDALLVVDDYAPSGATGDRQRLERDADRLLRAQGNRAGRQRMRADGSLRQVRPPRGLILSTGEDVPPGQSLRGRMFIVEVSPGDVPLARLTPHQQAAAAGLHAQALAGFVRGLAPQYGALCRRLPAERAAMRDKAMTGTGSARTPGIVADLFLGVKYFLDFAVEAGALNADRRDALARRGWEALQDGAAAQAGHVEAAEPCGQFLRLLSAVIASGRGHVAGPDGGAPVDAVRWAWRSVTIGSGEHEREDLRPQGHCIGWVDGTDLYLEREAAYAAANALAREQNEGLSVSAQTLWRRLKERGLLASWEGGRQRNTVRRTLGEVERREVLHLRADTLSTCTEPSLPSQPSTDRPETQRNGTVAVDCLGPNAAQPSTATVHQNGPNTAGRLPGGRLGRFSTEGEATPAGNGAPCPPLIPVVPNGHRKGTL